MAEQICRYCREEIRKDSKGDWMDRETHLSCATGINARRLHAPVSNDDEDIYHLKVEARAIRIAASHLERYAREWAASSMLTSSEDARLKRKLGEIRTNLLALSERFGVIGVECTSPCVDNCCPLHGIEATSKGEAVIDSEGRICSKHSYGEHIALTCKNHLTLRWSTKNIAPIGCRTIFYRSDEPECSCAASALQHVCEGQP